MKPLMLVLFVLLSGCASVADRYARAVGKAAAAGTSMPMLASYELESDEVSAYSLQRAVVARLQLAPAAFKAGITSPGSQARFDADGPVAGVLPAPMAQPDLDVGGYAAPMIELELAFRLARDVTEPIPAQAVGSVINCVVPALEFPDLGYADSSNLTVADIIASNVAGRAFWVGSRCARFSGVDGVQVSMERAGEVLTRGQASDAMGSQATAVAWLIERTLRSGYKLRAGQWLITGALGGMVPALPGRYRARYGQLGSVNFLVTQ